MEIVDLVKPTHIVTMMREDIGLKGNEFSQQCRETHKESIKFIDVESNNFKGVMNVKGAVQRNKKIKKALTFQP